VIKSTLPVIARVVFKLLARVTAASSASSTEWMESTPLVCASLLVRERTSDAFPLTTWMESSRVSRFAESVRNWVAPEPTGSRTIGIFNALAFFPARSMASTHWGVSVPIFRTRAPARKTISSTSSAACAMTGEAPQARRAFAV